MSKIKLAAAFVLVLLVGILAGYWLFARTDAPSASPARRHRRATGSLLARSDGAGTTLRQAG